jgi:ABC-2 type transport system ATP-binding protein
MAVRVEGLRVRRGGREVLPGISLSVAPGAVTTLMRAIVGVQIVDSGDVEVLGYPAGSPSLRTRVGYVTQAPSVYGDLSVRENLTYFARILNVSASRITETIEAVGLADRANQVVRSSSGGERSRVSLATALLNRPELLVLDEPTVGLDPVLRRDLWRLFRDLAEQGTTLLVSSHVLDEATHCDQLILLREGRVVAAEPPDAIRQRTGTDDLELAFLRLVEAA